MRKENKIFLLGILLMVGVLLSGCVQPASTGAVVTSTNDQLGDILDVVASQDPVSTAAPTDTTPDAQDSEGQGSEDSIPEPDLPEPTATFTPTPEPAATVPPINVDKTVPSEYALHKGEFPWCIARRFDLNPTTLLNANGISPARSQFTAGEVLKIPANIGSFEGNRQLREHTSPYRVKTGDTFYSIACYYGDLWPEEIAQANGMTLKDSLPAGTELIIP